jgi:hypothetical protein
MYSSWGMKFSSRILLSSRCKTQQFHISVPQSIPCKYTDRRIIWITSVQVPNCTVSHLRQQQSSCILGPFHYTLILFRTHHKWVKGYSAGGPYTQSWTGDNPDAQHVCIIYLYASQNKTVIIINSHDRFTFVMHMDCVVYETQTVFCISCRL